MPTGSGSGKGGKATSGHASPAALFDDQDVMEKRRRVFGEWKGKKKAVHPNHLINYVNSPTPPMPRKSS